MCQDQGFKYQHQDLKKFPRGLTSLPPTYVQNHLNIFKGHRVKHQNVLSYINLKRPLSQEFCSKKTSFVGSQDPRGIFLSR